jgi:heme exporter protein B
MATSFSTSAKGSEAAGSWWAEAKAVFAKDLRSEFRTKATLGSIAVYAVTMMALLAFMVKAVGLGFTAGLVANPEEAALKGLPLLENYQTKDRAILIASLYWLVIYFSAMASLPRIFVKEEEARTAAALRLAARPIAVFVGKLAFNLVLTVGVTLLVLPLFLLFYQPQIASFPMLLTVLVAGSAAMAAAATLLGAIASRTGSHGYVMVVLGFGPLLPILILGVNGTAAAIHGSPGNDLFGLVSYLVAMTVLSGLLFEKVWSE